MRVNGLESKNRNRARRRSATRLLAAALSALLFGGAFALGGQLPPATAAEGASILISKTVNGGKEARDLRPGDSVTYRVEFLANDEDADGPAVVVDALPAAFAGWQISDLVASFNNQRTGVTLDLPGVASGDSPALPASGALPSNPAELQITVGVALPVQAGTGNTGGTGIPTGAQGVLEYTITVPSDLSPNDPVLRTDLTNTATFTAMSGTRPLETSSSAIIEIDNPVVIDVAPAKSWSPAGQSYEPGAASTVTIGATQASNVPAGALRLQDPADPALAPDGASELPAGNPFNFVDFAGFTAPADPTSARPAGADATDVEVYRFTGASWNWVTWTAGIPNSEIAGVRTAYTSTEAAIAPGASVSQAFSVTQRETNRSSGANISTGWTSTNTVLATVEAPGQPPVSKPAEADFEVAPEAISVDAQKRFFAFPDGTETTALADVTAGETVGVVLRAINPEAPRSTTLDTLTIAEPGTGSDARFLGDDLIFGGFDNSDLDAVWPNGATSAEIVWLHDGGPTTVSVAQGDPLPAPPAGETITGFTIVYSGQITTNTAAEVRYRIQTNSEESFVAPGARTDPMPNVIDVTGTKAGLPDATDAASATLSLVAPRIDVTIDKRVGPGIVLPGQNVVVQLDTEVATGGGRTKPTEIVVEDAWGGAGTFWDAFDAKQILPPISRPLNSAEPAGQADLEIYTRDADGNWSPTPLVTNPAEDEAYDLPGGITGVRFVYTNENGLSQKTYVKPNLSFISRPTLRSDDSQPTATDFLAVERYENTASATGTGELDDRVVTGSDTDDETVGIRGSRDNGPEPGTGMWAAKAWADDVLTSQSGARTSTTQRWASTEPGYTTVELQDPQHPTASGEGTVFEAFNLTHVRPIRTGGSAGDGTVDPRLVWDVVTDVQLFDGTAWTSVTPVPGGSWMDANGFKGYALTPAQQLSTLGVRLVLAENTAAREAAGQAGDLTAPAVGTGVSASADIRAFRLDWQLRERARTADSSVKWVKEHDTAFNCVDAADGCIENVFTATGIRSDATSDSYTASDTIQVLDGKTNVDLVKQVQPIDAASGAPNGAPTASIGMTVPNPGELDPSDYPRARYTLTASNASTSESGAKGAMQLAKIRITDTQKPNSPAAIDESQFTGRDYAAEVAGPKNHFDTFTLTGVSFGTLPAYIDTAQSEVEVWVYDGTPAGAQEVFTLDQVLGGDPAFTALLPDVIGIATTFSGTDPEQNGNRIPAGAELVMHLDMQLREDSRLTGDPIEGGDLVSVVTVPNLAVARGWDAVVAPETQPSDTAQAAVDLREAAVQVGLRKTVSVQHGASSSGTIIETSPSDPVQVALTANSNGSTAPLNTLRIEDDTESFWKRFEFVSFGTLTAPKDADTAGLQVQVEGAWVPFDVFTGDPGSITGVAVDFSRAAGNGLFPQGASSWNASWGTAVLPFTVRLRADAEVDWSGDLEQNTAIVVADNREYGSADDDADAEVTFGPGTHSLRVSKRAPNDTGTHQVEPLVNMPWQLVFTNTGTGYLPITSVTDALPSTLEWDGEQPTFTSAPGASGKAGLSSDPADVTISRSEDGDSLVFTWPAGSRMEPGETMTIGLGLALQPVPTGTQAQNTVTVETGVPLAVCQQPNDFGQQPPAPVEAYRCSNTNFVQPRAGTVVGAAKTVNGEHLDTLGENLVNGALDVRTGDECLPTSYRPVGSGYTRNPCASYTAVGATDTWKLQHFNTGTNPLSRMTIVDMMPTVGDKMLAGGAARGSTFRPVLVGEDLADVFRFTGLPAGATTTVEVTSNPAACVGDVPGASLWVSDPTCSDTATNPANVWTPLEAYTGAVADIAGIRVDIDMAVSPLAPAGEVTIEFETVNRVVDASAQGLRAALDQYATPQFAWNQNGVIAWDTSGNRVNLPSTPQRAGVTVKTAPLVISKEVAGPGAANAPEEFPVALSCTVPSGVADPARVALDLGDSATVMVPKNGSATVPGLPIGTDCTASEAGALGAHGETGRSIEAGPGVSPATDGLSAEVRIREQADGETHLRFGNTYTLGGIVVEKSVLSADEHPVGDDRRSAEYSFELVCEANGLDEPITKRFALRAGERHAESELPEGARCTLTETGDGGAKSSSITVSGEETAGTNREGIVVAAGGTTALVSNVFDGVPPVSPTEDPAQRPDDALSTTGADLGALAAATVALLAAGAAGSVLAGRRRKQADV
jgi:hypothetical protein